MKLQHGKKYRVNEQGATYSELVTIDNVSSRGVVTITIGGGFLGQGSRLDLSPKRVAQLNWVEQ